MKLGSVAIVNRSRSNVRSVTVHDLTAQASELEPNSIPPQVKVAVPSEKDGNKNVSVQGWL